MGDAKKKGKTLLERIEKAKERDESIMRELHAKHEAFSQEVMRLNKRFALTLQPMRTNPTGFVAVRFTAIAEAIEAMEAEIVRLGGVARPEIAEEDTAPPTPIRRVTIDGVEAVIGGNVTDEQVREEIARMRERGEVPDGK